MGIEERIPAMQHEMVEYLRKLLRISSVRSEERRPGAPFGPELAQVLSEVLAWGEAEGFRVKNVGGFAGHLEYGTGEDYIGVLGHLDVVPAGEGWTSPAFGADIREGRIYGRGAVDDKGPTVAAMYALKALKDSGAPLKHKVRLIVGCDEESNWECMDAYFKEEPKPLSGFTPDADFPLIFCEKGQLSVTLTDRIDRVAPEGVRIRSLAGGTRRNIVPDHAWAVVSAASAYLAAAQGRLQEIAAKDPLLTFQSTGPDEIRIDASGKAAHGSMPDLGDNALARLMAALNSLDGKGGAWPMVRFLASYVGGDYSGAGLGIAAEDPVSGPLTLNFGVLQMDADTVRAQFDIRYPISVKGEMLTRTIREEANKAGLTVEAGRSIPPHHVEQDHPLVLRLLEAYRAETGDMTPPMAVGGRTYATTMGTAVAFGPMFPGQPEAAHQRDESISIDDLIRCARIYARALEALAAK